MKVIELNADDDIVSVCDLLDWEREHRVVLRMPEASTVLGDGVSLARLRRHADRLRVDVGLVTSDRRLARKANGIGLPAFTSVEEAATSRRGWWRGRRRRELVGLPTLGRQRLPSWRDQPENDAIGRLSRPVSRRHWAMRYLAIILFFVAIASVIIWLAYALPRATIVLEPEVIESRALPQVLVDPTVDQVDHESRTIPGRLVEVSQSWSEETKTSGSVIVPVSQARGRVILVNKTDRPVPVPQGTLLSSADGAVTFQTATQVRMVGVISSTAEIDVFAVEAGPQGNVEAGSITRIEDELSESLDVSNPEAMRGGELRQVAAVAEEDRVRLRAQVLQFLQAVSWAEMQSQLTEREFLPRESLQVVAIDSETYSHIVGEPAQTLRLKMDARLRGTSIDLTQASGLVYEALSASTPVGYTLVGGSIEYGPGDVLSAEENGRVSLVINGSGVLSANLASAGPIAAITGQEPEFALAYLLETLPLRETPQIEVWPTWFRRIPYRTARIGVEISHGELPGSPEP